MPVRQQGVPCPCRIPPGPLRWGGCMGRTTAGTQDLQQEQDVPLAEVHVGHGVGHRMLPDRILVCVSCTQHETRRGALRSTVLYVRGLHVFTPNRFIIIESPNPPSCITVTSRLCRAFPSLPVLLFPHVLTRFTPYPHWIAG